MKIDLTEMEWETLQRIQSIYDAIYREIFCNTLLPADAVLELKMALDSIGQVRDDLRYDLNADE